MREHKYRFWSPEHKLMSEPIEIFARFPYSIDIVFLDKDGTHAVGFGEGYLVPLEYTGLKDKNGVEIYEGDICEFPYKQGDGSTELEADEVNFTDGQFALFKWALKDWASKCAVIGNIYANPELVQ